MRWNFLAQVPTFKHIVNNAKGNATNPHLPTPPSLQKQTNFTSGSTSHPMGLDTGNSMKNENTPVFIFHFEKHIRNTSQQNSSYLYAYIHVGTK